MFNAYFKGDGLYHNRNLFDISKLRLPLKAVFAYIIVVLAFMYLKTFKLKRSKNTKLDQKDSLLGDKHGELGLLNKSAIITLHQRALCRYRQNAHRTIMVHLHIPKSAGTAFALALKSECQCRRLPRPKLGYCKRCPHVLLNESLPVPRFRQNVWTLQNHTFHPHYNNCSSAKASARWFGFQTHSNESTFYSQNRLTSGWPCGVHASYARLRMCHHRLQLKGVRHAIVTLFRDPVSRFVSEYYHVAYNRKEISSWDWCLSRSKPLTFSEFVSMPVYYPFQSRMTKLLSGSPVQTGAAGADWRLPFERKSALMRALNVVSSTEDFLFGLAEDLPQTLKLFRFAFKRQFNNLPLCHSHHNSSDCQNVHITAHDLSGAPFKISSEHMQWFEARNREDIEVFRHSKNIFYARISALDKLLELGSDRAIDHFCREILN